MPTTKKLVRADSPAFNRLRPMQQQFVMKLFEIPGINGMAALRAIGYTGNEMACKKQSDRWRHDERILAAIKEYGEKEYLSRLPNVIAALGNVIDDPTHRDHVKVLHGLLDRVGMHAVTESKTTVVHKVERSELITKLASLIDRHQVLPSPSVALPPPAVDAEFVEAAAAPLPHSLREVQNE